MPEDVLLVKRGEGLFSTDLNSDEALGEIPQGEIVRCKWARPRNVRHHRMFWGLMTVVWKAQTFYADKDDMVDDIKIAVGHFHLYTSADGTRRARANSIAFDKMDETGFSQFFDKAVEFVVTQILPFTDRADLEREVYNILGGPGPDDFR